ncbi:hypothetical protein TNCV_1940351 [Trichonephila clavipes]|nr:hypothetical protein TNCV_1940351 [Trichonephila clavipes]
MLTPIIHFIGLLGSPSLPSSTPLVPASETPPTIPPSRNTKPTISPDRGRRNQFLIPVPCEIQQCCVVTDSSVLCLVISSAWCCDLVDGSGRSFGSRDQWGGRGQTWRTKSANEMDDRSEHGFKIKSSRFQER